MIHSVMGGNHGSLHNMMNELEAIEQLQDMYCDALIAETGLARSSRPRATPSARGRAGALD